VEARSDPRSLKAHVLLVAITLIWGATFVTIKDALGDASPLAFNLLRMLLATLCLAAIFPKQLKRAGRAEVIASLPVGVFLFLGYTLQTSGLRLTTPSKSAFITGLSVVLVPLFMFILFRRKLSVWSAAGVLAALVGLALLALPPGQQWHDLAAINPGDVLTSGCAVSFALHIIFLGRATSAQRVPRVSYKSVAVLQTLFATVLMAAALPLARPLTGVGAFVQWTPRLAVALIITAVLATALAFAVQSWAQQFTPPTHTALIFALEPVFALITSYVLLGERLGGRALVGCASILGSVLLSELMPQRD
jgi:drug/metabolite transporter (DMT)-like permease